MKMKSRVILGVAMGAMAFTTLAGTVQAAGTDREVVLSYTDMRMYAPFEARADMVAIESRGTYDALQYDVMFGRTSVAGFEDETGGQIDMRYTPYIFGPAVSYAFNENNSEFGIGLAAVQDFGLVDTYAQVTSDVDAFGDIYFVTAGVRYQVTDKVTGMGEFNSIVVDGYDNVNFYELGGRYAVTSDFFAEASYTSIDLGRNAPDADALKFGVGFNF